MPDSQLVAYTWNDLFRQTMRHRGLLVRANLIAILTAILSVPIPLLIPLLVDEVLLKKPGPLTQFIDQIFPSHWHGAILYVMFVTVITILLRLTWLLFSVWQTREFTLISKDITFHIRQRLLEHIETVAMAEYET
ncbi:MAG TPA: ABC transporter ATP-binding protein, partial [Thiolinea sp.]|nr:ABC transporter ATP-binding protein [Thiolinea sp.]